MRISDWSSDVCSSDLYPGVPLTMGYYTRDDLPFNYAMADAFTICDQHFCSGMTSTWPNRLFLWSGTIRGKHSGDAKAYIRNDIRSEEHTSELPSLMRISYAVFCLKKKNDKQQIQKTVPNTHLY